MSTEKKRRSPIAETDAFDKDTKIVQTLKTRAKELAEAVQENDETRMTLEIVEFGLAYERYGIESSYVREVYPMKEFTPLPCTPSFVLGIINVRGQVMSVVDIRRFFELPVKGLTDLNRVVVVQSNQMEMGILADRILGVRLIGLDSVQTSLPTLTGVRSDYLKGVTHDRVVLLDVEKMLNDKRFFVNEDVE